MRDTSLRNSAVPLRHRTLQVGFWFRATKLGKILNILVVFSSLFAITYKKVGIPRVLVNKNLSKIFVRRKGVRMADLGVRVSRRLFRVGRCGRLLGSMRRHHGCRLGRFVLFGGLYGIGGLVVCFIGDRKDCTAVVDGVMPHLFVGTEARAFYFLVGRFEMGENI